MNKLSHCDCVEGMRNLPNDLIDFTLTSPPYDDVRTYAPLPFPKFQQVGDELFRITKPGGIVVWVVQEQIKNGSQTGTSSEQRLYFRDIGFFLWDRLLMTRYGRRNTAGLRYGMPIEEAFILSKGEPTNVSLWKDKRNKNPGKIHTFHNRLPNGEFRVMPEKLMADQFGIRPNIWRYPVGRHIASEAWVRRAAHGALMPEKMAEDLILSYSKPDNLVFDPMAGLATTCKMALLNHRRFLGMEINEAFVRLAERRMRLANIEYQQRLHEMLKGNKFSEPRRASSPKPGKERDAGR